MILAFDETVTHGQIVVHQTARRFRGFSWTDDHVSQGFAWSPDTVAFGVPDHDGSCRVEAMKSHGPIAIDPSALWAVAVPLDVDGGCVEVFSVQGIGHRFDLAGGRYALVFEALPGATIGPDHAFVLRLTFRLDAGADFAILKRGLELSTDTVLSRTADPVA